MSGWPARDRATGQLSDRYEESDGAPAETGAQVTTACNGHIRYVPGTAWAIYQGQKIFFCLPVCKEDFEADPGCSCLAIKLCHLE